MLDLLWKMTRPVLFSMDAEKAHMLIIENLQNSPKWTQALLDLEPTDSSLSTSLAGIPLRSPIGMAAGLDKDGVAIPVWPKLGFGFIEIGTVTAHPQEGNPKPRLFRLKKEKGIINRMGFNNHGSAALATTIKTLKSQDLWPSIPVGANVGKSKITPLDKAGEDYKTSIERLQGLVDYFTINVSSPNTPGLRELQSAEKLKLLLEQALPSAGQTPVFVKFAPDMADEDLSEALETIIELGCSGVIATNTTNQRPNTTDRLTQGGGLSGDPLWPIARPKIEQILNQVEGRIPVVGVGGVNSVERAQELLNMGCTAVQLYSALIFEGPGLINKINKGLILD
ncbi:MAG: dihydroorotate dehydrogenase (quinone) [Proteobacteria bacterium]|nr:dihydroorotate dehydrogenase (quinone) [Pseudomonadota bacterium]